MTDTTTFESIDLSDGQRKSQREKTAIEFFREKFADDEETVEFIDPKGDHDGQHLVIESLDSTSHENGGESA